MQARSHSEARTDLRGKVRASEPDRAAVRHPQPDARGRRSRTEAQEEAFLAEVIPEAQKPLYQQGLWVFLAGLTIPIMKR